MNTVGNSVTIKVTEKYIRANEKAVYSITCKETLLGSVRVPEKKLSVLSDVLHTVSKCMFKFLFHYSLLQFELTIVYSFSFSMCPGWSSVLGILANKSRRRQLLESFHHKDNCNTF